MRIVIQCAAVKTAGAGSLADAGGTPILFVAHPALAPADVARVHARPDDLSDDGRTWRASLLAYNSDRSVNSLNLLPAYQLYARDVYRGLVDRFGPGPDLHSAGWGLIPADFLIANYDIAFTDSQTVEVPAAERALRRSVPDA